MEAMRESWTDARLDDFRAETARRSDELGRRIDNGFNRMSAETAALRKEMNERFEAVDKRFESVDRRFEAVDRRFEAMHRLLVQLCGGVIVALIGLIATQP
jgi:chaperonin cofactor prefoldin